MKRVLIAVFCVVIFLSLSVTSFASGTSPRLIDDADILSMSEENYLLAYLNELSNVHGVDIVVYTVDSIGYSSASDYAEELFEYHGYGIGVDRSCIMLFLSMEERDWHILTAGYGITAVTEVGFDYISELIVPYLSDDDYFNGISAFVDCCDNFINRAKAGDPFDEDDLPKESFPFGQNLIICLIIGAVAAWIYVSKQKAKLKTVRYKANAKDYTKEGSFDVNLSKDFFLYRTVNRSARSDSSGSSSTHKTSRGTTVGGRSGKF